MQFLKHPATVGNLLPYSKHVCLAIEKTLSPNRLKIVSEFGPGMGTITPYILRRLPSDSFFFAVEILPDLCKEFKKNHPNINIFNRSIEDIKNILEDLKVPRINTIVSTIPWANFPKAVRTRWLSMIYDVLAPEGQLITVAHLHTAIMPSGISFKHQLQNQYQKVEISPYIWKHILPTRIYRCTK
jgi:phosphatidylethanolamine/phosphatidyl-N-methylethanolamine N-methyltransferase